MKNIFTLIAVALFSLNSYAQESVILENLPSDCSYKLSATIQGSTGSSFILYNNADGSTPIDLDGLSNIGPNLSIENGGMLSIAGLSNDLNSNRVFSALYESDDITGKFDIEFIINQANNTYTFKAKKNTETEFTTVFEDEPFFFEQQADDSYMYREIALTHYYSEGLTVENVTITPIYKYGFSVGEGRDFTFTASVVPTMQSAIAFMGETEKETFNPMDSVAGPAVLFMADKSIAVLEGMNGVNYVFATTVNNYTWTAGEKYDIKYVFDAQNFTYTFSIKKNSEDDSAYVVIVEDLDYFYIISNGATYMHRLNLTDYFVKDICVFDPLISEHKNSDAALSDLTVDGVSIEGFESEWFDYYVDLEPGTTTMPSVTATAVDATASVVITPTTELPGTTTVEVTAEDGVTVLTYNVIFEVLKSTDATLSSITMGGVELTGFDSQLLVYDVALEAGTTLDNLPIIEAITTWPGADVQFTLPESLPGEVKIDVIAEDASTVKTYSINLTVLLGINDGLVSVGIYPNPANMYIKIESVSAIELVEIYNITGSLVEAIEVISESNVELGISGLQPGIYLVQVKTSNGISTKKLVKE